MQTEDRAHLPSVTKDVTGEEIRRRREAAGLDQVQLAREAGIGRTTLHNIETGVSHKPATRAKVLRALEAAEEESGVEMAPSETPEVEEVTYEAEGVFGIKVVRAKGPKADHVMLREDVIAIIRAIQQGNGGTESEDPV